MTPIGLDLSLSSTGVAVWGGYVGLVRTDLTEAKRVIARGSRSKDIGRRRYIAEEVYARVLGADLDRLLVIEKSHATAVNRKTGLDLAALHAVVLDELDALPGRNAVAYVYASTLKKHLAGQGKASKTEMIAAAQACGYGGSQEDEADAYGLALIGRHLTGGLDHMTPHRLSCLAAVEWIVPLPS